MGGCTEVSATKVYHCCRSERLELLVVESFVCVAGWVELGVGVEGRWEVGLIYVDFGRDNNSLYGGDTLK